LAAGQGAEIRLLKIQLELVALAAVWVGKTIFLLRRDQVTPLLWELEALADQYPEMIRTL
jgi:hypothetical protein